VEIMLYTSEAIAEMTPGYAHGVARKVHSLHSNTFHQTISCTDEPCNDLFNDSKLKVR